MGKRTVVNGKVMRTPNLGAYDNRRGYPHELHQPEQVMPDFKAALSLEKEMPSTRNADYALLVALGVNGEVPFHVAAAIAGLVVAANDNFKYAIAA